MRVVTVTVADGYRARPDSLTAIARIAKSAKLLRSSTRWRLSVEDTLFEWLAEHLEDMTPALREFVQEEHAMVRQRHLARPRDLAAADPPHIRDGMMRGVT
jgi:hypothetical protein